MSNNPSLLDLMGDTGQKPKEIAADNPSPRITESCDLELILHYDNEVKAAIQVSETGDVSKAVWLPKSEIEFRLAGRNAPATTTAGNPVPGGLPVIIANVPEWLAKEKGLI